MNVQVIKIGGNVIDDDVELRRFLEDFVTLSGPKILVHGGGKLATRLASELGVETSMVEGRRVTSPAMLDVAVMVYAGLVNKRIVAILQSLGCNAIGLCGADGKCIVSVKRRPEPVDYGMVGDVTGVDSGFFTSLLRDGLTPVVCAITVDNDGNLLNTNADTIASSVAKSMARESDTSLIFCFEKNGVMADPDDESSLIERIDSESAEQLIADGVIQGGMIPKVRNAVDTVVTTPVVSVIIKNSRNLTKHTGTLIVR